MSKSKITAIFALFIVLSVSVSFFLINKASKSDNINDSIEETKIISKNKEHLKVNEFFKGSTEYTKVHGKTLEELGSNNIGD